LAELGLPVALVKSVGRLISSVWSIRLQELEKK